MFWAREMRSSGKGKKFCGGWFKERQAYENMERSSKKEHVGRGLGRADVKNCKESSEA